MLLHGYTDSCLSFSQVLAHLPDSLHIFAISQRGHGDSDRPANGYQMQNFAADLNGFMDAVGINKAVVVGHSMGSVVAMHAAVMHPDRVTGLVLIGAMYTPVANNPDLSEFSEMVATTIDDPVAPEFVREFQESTLARPISDTFFDTILEESLKVPGRVWRETMRGMQAADVTEQVDNINVPTLIIWGEQDGMAQRADQEALKERISNARLIVYPGAGHGTHWEEPERFAADLTEFVESVAS